MLGSAQIRISHRGEVWVASGDYKLERDGVSAPFEPLRCDAFITESTFGLPIYRFARRGKIIASIDAWRRDNAGKGRASLLFAYALGKAQRVLAHIDASIGPIVCHGAIEATTRFIGRPASRCRRSSHAERNQQGRILARALILAACRT